MPSPLACSERWPLAGRPCVAERSLSSSCAAVARGPWSKGVRWLIVASSLLALDKLYSTAITSFGVRREQSKRGSPWTNHGSTTRMQTPTTQTHKDSLFILCRRFALRKWTVSLKRNSFPRTFLGMAVGMERRLEALVKGLIH